MRKLLGLLILVSSMAVGQEMDTLAIDTVKKTPNFYGGIYFDGGYKVTPHPPGNNLVEFIGGGIQYNRWSLGFRAYDFKGTIQRFLIFPNIFELQYRYGGPIVSYDVIQSKWVNTSLMTSFYKGDMIWRSIRSNEDFLRSKFNVLTVGAKIEMVRLRFIRPYINGGYQQMSGLELTGVNNEGFSGFFLGAGILLGYFNQ